MKCGELYNIVMSHPGEASLYKWDEPGNLEEMKEPYHNFDPIVKRVLNNITRSRKWTLADLPSLNRWASRGRKIALIGDSAHAMLPYLAQVYLCSRYVF
jgi:salicylate hydroxylase